MSTKITIAQGLRRVAKLKGQIAEYTSRAVNSVSHVEGKLPSFTFKESVLALRAAKEELVDLQSRIAVANAKATVEDAGETVTHAEAIRRLQEFKGEMSFLRSLNLRNEVEKVRESDWDEVNSRPINRVTEVTWVSDLSEQERDQQIKSLQDRFEALNNTLEDRNHKVAV